MKKVAFVFLLLLISFGVADKLSARSLKSTEEKFEVDNHQEYSIKQAIELAYPSALKWDGNAHLLHAVNIDLEDNNEKFIGSKGKKYWNISFGVPDTNKFFLVTIYKGEIERINDVTNIDDSPYPEKEFIALEDIHYDSHQLLKKALKLGIVKPGKDWAKGYSFMIRKDSQTNVPLLFVIGWNKEQTEMRSAVFSASTGEYVKPDL
ncbi:hypothetical protein DVB69_12425 [Sporosarcina sp. BI001-red]|uniref:hypothetical protein n=1 Tax=Sporosarcina sp. BI001-red TaxID=2282866 RepID=UPI000E23CC33|nr:hypothetical protein [Sporosarcina sp. BI001-red]REB06503.1 hypothetical protein DVB69_12425 [Sporosarcina sp. BI001-red]